MLKIKENIDLKELEKFGFEKADFNSKYYIRYIYINKPENYETLYFDINTRELFAYNDYYDEKIDIKEEWIKDIKEADLVEKV